LLSAAFDNIGHSARALYLPLPDALMDFRQGWLDAVWVCGNTHPESKETWHWSEPLIPRQISAITLAESDMPISSVPDLSGKTVGIHPEVSEVLGDTGLQLQEIDPPLQSIANHALLLLKLFTRRIDVLIEETSTFEYFRNKLPATVQPGQGVVTHEIFPPIYPRLIFRDAKLRDEFNAAWYAVYNNIAVEPAVARSTAASGFDRKK
jgi:ABC-type amino acid transport substrate-binding protein